GWVNPDVIGIDLGITLLSAENLRTGRVWSWFMEIPKSSGRSSGPESGQFPTPNARGPGQE
ncbi:MAG: glucoamylase family protein, partial [Vicinamibacterales bacterium]